MPVMNRAFPLYRGQLCPGQCFSWRRYLRSSVCAALRSTGIGDLRFEPNTSRDRGSNTAVCRAGSVQMLFQTTMLKHADAHNGHNVTVGYQFRACGNTVYLRKQQRGVAQDVIRQFTPLVKRGCMIASPRDAEPPFCATQAPA